MVRTALGATFVLAIATWVALLARIVSDGANHVAVEPLLAALPFALLLLLTWSRPRRVRRGARVALTVFSLISIVAIVGFDRTNVLVQYERWIQRGMPERPCKGIAKYLWTCRP